MQLPYFYTSTDVARVNVAMDIPAGVMKFEKQKGKFRGQMEVLGIAYKADGSVAARFSDTVKREFEDKKEVEAFEKAPFHYENQFEIASGKYNVKVVFSAGDKTGFGKMEMPLNVDAWDSGQFGLSALALSKQVRAKDQVALTLDQSLLEDRVPLITQGFQIIPAGTTRFQKAAPPLFYAEVYEPLLVSADAKEKPVVGIQIRILDRKTKEQKATSGLMRLENVETHGPVMAMGERLPIEALGPGQYTVELQAVDTAGKQMTRTADFDLE